MPTWYFVGLVFYDLTKTYLVSSAEENVKTGLKIAYDALGVFPRIKVEEFMNHEITELNMATYMWQFRVRIEKAFKVFFSKIRLS